MIETHLFIKVADQDIGFIEEGDVTLSPVEKFQ